MGKDIKSSWEAAVEAAQASKALVTVSGASGAGAAIAKAFADGVEFKKFSERNHPDPINYVALCAERDAAVARHKDAVDQLFKVANLLTEARAECDAWQIRTKYLEGDRDILAAENMALRDQLARFTTANVEPEKPAPQHNPFREFRSDRRRMGP